MAKKAKPANQRIEVTLGPDVGSKVFQSFEEVQTWLNEEINFWQPVRQASAMFDTGRRAWQPMQSALNDIQSILTSFSQSKQREDEVREQTLALSEVDRETEMARVRVNSDAFRAKLESCFRSHYGTDGIFSSKSPQAKLCLSLVQNEGPARGLSALAYFLRTPIDVASTEHLAGAVAAYCFEQGITPRTPAETESLSELRRDWNAQFQSLKDDLQKQAEDQSNLNAQLSKQLADQTSQFNSLLLKQKDDWAALHKTYDSSLALSKPVTFWRHKAKSHCWQAWIFGLVSLITASVVFYLLYTLIQITLQPPANSPASWHPEYSRISVLIASAVFGVWVIRIFVRLFLSHVHLHSDAKERVTMALTYLSLLRSDKTMTAKERDLILHALFRQAATGVVKDDGIPLAAVEYLTRTGR